MRKTMKKVPLVCLALLACALMFTACDSDNENQTPNDTMDSATDGTTEPETEAHVHSFGEWTTVKEATCTKKGEQERVCACGEKETKSLHMVAHTEVIDEAVAPTCTETGLTEGKHCSVCNTVMTKQEVVKANGHTDGDWIVDKEATAKDDGAKHQICSVCKETLKSETLPATGSVGLAYELNTSGTGYIVTGIGTCKNSAVYIPAVYNGLPVTEIARRAFYNCSAIIEITIPFSIETIGTQVFYKAQNLHTVYYNSTYSSAENPFFSQSSVKKIVFGNDVPKHILTNCTSVESIEIADGVTSIGEYAFENCTGLKNITIGNSVKNIGDCALTYCPSLTEITVSQGNTVYHSEGNCLIETASKTLVKGSIHSIIPSDGSVTSIGESAFRGYTSMTSMNIPVGIISIGDSAFIGCTGLTSIIIPDSVTTIDFGAFRDCTNLTDIDFGDCITSIGERAFYGCTGLTSITLPDSVTSIGPSAFISCSRLTSVILGNSVDSIGSKAFAFCDSLTNIDIPDSVTYMDGYVFENSGLTSITIPDSITKISGGMFAYCDSLTSVTLSDSIIVIDFHAFLDCYALKSIFFDGTMQQWNALEKSYDWDTRTGNYTVYCTDGNITK